MIGRRYSLGALRTIGHAGKNATIWQGHVPNSSTGRVFGIPFGHVQTTCPTAPFYSIMLFLRLSLDQGMPVAEVAGFLARDEKEVQEKAEELRQSA
jgi:hypothetical protein